MSIEFDRQMQKVAELNNLFRNSIVSTDIDGVEVDLITSAINKYMNKTNLITYRVCRTILTEFL